MRIDPSVERYRIRVGCMGSDPGDQFGMFDGIPGPCGRDLRVIASEGDRELGVPWEHVSVSIPTRCPNWPEMCHIKELFWDDEDAVIQFHPPKSEYVNNHNYCLHLWRPMDGVFPMPPKMAA